MTDSEFYAQIQSEWFNEFKDAEVSKIFQYSYTHDEFFNLDVPF